MKTLYLNSEFFPVSERFHYFSRKPWDGLVHLEGPRILVGHDPHLFASHVLDLRTECEQSSGAQIVRWTQRPGLTLDLSKHHGKPIEKVFRISVDGEISEDRHRS